jgi:peroxiredoxin Q/BCP
VGAAIPVVVQKNQDDVTTNVAETGANGYLLVYFYPKSDTPGCTKQACSLRDSYAALTEKGVEILGVSMDSVKAQKAFKDKYRLPFDLLADKEDGVGSPQDPGFCQAAGVSFQGWEAHLAGSRRIDRATSGGCS